MKLNDMIKAYEDEGYDNVQAQARVSQDVVVMNIAASPLKRNVTIKGGVVMHNISHDSRRATQDIDFDFIHYSLSDESIRLFLNKISNVEFKLELTGEIEELRQQDYHGKRVHIVITDADGTADHLPAELAIVVVVVAGVDVVVYFIAPAAVAVLTLEIHAGAVRIARDTETVVEIGVNIARPCSLEGTSLCAVFHVHPETVAAGE